MARKKSAGERRKKVTVKLLDRKHGGKVTEAYRLMDQVIETVKEHQHLKRAKIAICWMIDKKADADGRLVFGRAKKASDMDRDLSGYDLVVLLNKEVWDARLDESQKLALLDHELCHFAQVMDEGTQKQDEDGRYCWRIRKHDIEEFRNVVKRRGLYLDDLREFIEAAQFHEQRPLLQADDEPEEAESHSDAEPAVA